MARRQVERAVHNAGAGLMSLARSKRCLGLKKIPAVSAGIFCCGWAWLAPAGLKLLPEHAILPAEWGLKIVGGRG
jgi:hypothetical protein